MDVEVSKNVLRSVQVFSVVLTGPSLLVLLNRTLPSSTPISVHLLLQLPIWSQGPDFFVAASHKVGKLQSCRSLAAVDD